MTEDTDNAWPLNYFCEPLNLHIMPPRKTKPKTKSRPKSKSRKKVKKVSPSPEQPKSTASNKPTPLAAWNYNVETCLDEYQTDLETGLSTAQANELMDVWGPNSLDKEEKKTVWELFVEQFDDPLVKILLGAAAVSFFIAYSKSPGADGGHGEGVGAFVEPGVILLILVLNAGVGVWQESNAESALEALKDMQPKTARVWRDGEFNTSLLASQLVPGDVVHLQAGDMIPADCRILLLKTTTFGVEQASLTGESVVVFKEKEILDELGRPAVIQDKHNMAFSGTTCASGEAIAVVQATGMSTEFGQIQAQIQQARADTEDDDTPLGAKLKDFGEQLTLCIGVVCLLVWIIKAPQFIQFDPDTKCGDDDGCFRMGSMYFMWRECLECFKIAVALAVAAIPEGLPAVITTCLALGTRKMAKRNALVRKLPSVETLGCTTVICSDKTGTLTTNKMAVTSMLTVDTEIVQVYNVTGSTYDPSDGEFDGAKKSGHATTMASQICALCNDSLLFHNTAEEVQDGEEVLRDGSPTEAALRVLAEKIAAFEGVSVSSNKKGEAVSPASDMYNEQYPRICKLEFNRRRKSMSVLCYNESGNAFDTTSTTNKSKKSKKGKKSKKTKASSEDQNILFVKGAPESVLSRCELVLLEDGTVVRLDDDIREEMNNEIFKLSSNALRCIGLAFNPSLSSLPGDLSLLSDYDGSEDHPGHAVLKTPGIEVEVESNLIFVGVAGMRDPPRAQVRGAIQECRTAGVRVIVITGDNQGTAEAICTQIGLFEKDDDLSSLSFVGHEFAAMSRKKQIKYLLDAKESGSGMVFSRAEPKFKQNIVNMLKGDELNEITAMTGDGVNDAPALAAADIGIAMGISGTEVAQEASDMVLADDNFATIVNAIEEGRAIYNNMKAFIRYMISSNVGEVVSIFITAFLGLPDGLISVQLLWVNLVTDGPPATALGFNPPDNDIMDKPPRSSTEALISRWTFIRYIVVGLYVGVATVGIFVMWYSPTVFGLEGTDFLGVEFGGDGHPLLTYAQLSGYKQCGEPGWNVEGGFTDTTSFKYETAAADSYVEGVGCDYFDGANGRKKASTLSLSVLVTIEMLNALNALSEDNSLLVMRPWINPYLIAAMFVSFALHFMILHVDWMAELFSIVPLDYNEWLLVLLWSFPVILIDEVLKAWGRRMNAQELAARLKQD